MTTTLEILNIGLDRGLLTAQSEAQMRQILYAHRLPARITHVLKVDAQSSSEPFTIAQSLQVAPVPVRHWLQFIPRAIAAGSQCLKRRRFDLIQAQEPMVCGLAGAYLSRRFRIPLVVGVFADEIDNPVWLAESPLHRLANPIAKKVLANAAASRADSRAVTEKLAHYRFPNFRYIPFLITNATSLQQPAPAVEERRGELLQGLQGPLLVAVSRLEPEKNMPLLLEAFAEAAKRQPDIVLAIAGSGRLEQQLKDKAESMVPGRVRWLGWIDNRELPTLYQAADLSLLSSNRESAARVLFESLLAGTPVLSTDTAGAREAIEDNVCGRIVPVGDVVAFTSALVELCASPDHLQEMGTAGRRHAAALVSTDAVIQQLRAFYDTALQSSPTGTAR